MMQGKITEADTSTIRMDATPSGLITAHLHHPPFLCWMLFHNPPTLSWLGTGTKYVGLHPQWHGCTVNQSNTPKIPHAHIHHFDHMYATWSPDILLPLLLKKNLCRFLSGQMPFLSPNQQCQSTKDNQTHTHGKMSTGYAANMRDVPVNDSMSSSSSSSWRGRGCSMTFPSSSTVSTSMELGYNSYTTKSIHSTLKNITVQVSINLHGSTHSSTQQNFRRTAHLMPLMPKGSRLESGKENPRRNQLTHVKMEVLVLILTKSVSPSD